MKIIEYSILIMAKCSAWAGVITLVFWLSDRSITSSEVWAGAFVALMCATLWYDRRNQVGGIER